MARDDDGPDAGGAGSGEAKGPERLRICGSSAVRALLRSAEVDVPSPLARARAQVAADRALEAPPSEAPSRARADLAIAALGGAVAALLGAWLWSLSGDEQAASRPERSSTAPSQASSARAEPAACPRISSGSGREPSIDDFEDGNARAIVADGRSGVWSAIAEVAGERVSNAEPLVFPVQLSEPGRTSRFVLPLDAARVATGSVGVSLELAPGRCYDASAYAGIELLARGTGRVYLSATMVDVAERKRGGLCELDCEDPHAAPLDLTSEWRRFEVRWSELERARPDRSLGFDAARLLAIGVSARGADTPIEAAIDDVRFIAR